MRILVTGATGVVGRRMVPRLTAAGHDVLAAGRNPEQRARLERTGARVVPLDLFDRDAVRRAVAGRDAVINLATHIPPSALRALLPGAWRENDRLRRDATAILGEAATAAGVPRWIQESFAPIYAGQGDHWIDEQSPVQPARYQRTMLDAERAVERFTRAGGAGVVLRFGGFYGPDAWQVRQMLDSVRRGWSPFPGAAGAYWSSISHDDAASAVLAVLEAPAGIYNASDDEPLTRRAYVDAFADAFGLPHPKLLPAWVATLMGSPGEALSRSQRISNAKLRTLGWRPRHPSVREGFRAVAEALRADARGTSRGSTSPAPS